MWIHPLRLTVTAFALLPCVIVAAPTYENFEDGTVLVSNNKHGLEKRSIYFQNWSGCEDPQKNEIINAWKNMLEMANKIKDKIDFEEIVARDFFGDPKQITIQYQESIRRLIKHVSTWTFGSVFAWHMDMICDDFRRKEFIKRNHGNEAFGCPPGTAEEDHYKCKYLLAGGVGQSPELPCPAVASRPWVEPWRCLYFSCYKLVEIAPTPLSPRPSFLSHRLDFKVFKR